MSVDLHIHPAPAEQAPPPGYEVPGEHVSEPPLPVPRGVRSLTKDDVLSFAGALISSFCLVYVGYLHLLDLSGLLGFGICWYVVFVAVYSAVLGVVNPAYVVRDRILAATVCLAATIVVLALASTILYTFIQGWHALVHLNFYTHDMDGVSPTAGLNHGGLSNALVGTLIEVGIAIVISVPLGIGTAVYMTEVGGRLSNSVRTVVEAMTAIPEILAGLFVYVLLIVEFGMSKSGLAVSVAMSVTMVPIIARAGEVALRVVPSGLREASQRAGCHPLEDRLQGGAPFGACRSGHSDHPRHRTRNRRDGDSADLFGSVDLHGGQSRWQSDELTAPLHLRGIHLARAGAGDQGIRRSECAPDPRSDPVQHRQVPDPAEGNAAMRSRLPVLAARGVATMVVLLIASALLANATAGAVTPSLINGSGSSWAANAVNQWVTDVANQGIQVVYSPDGDSAGRQDFANGTSDFAVTAEGYQGVDPSTGLDDTSNGRLYSYVPIAAGGTAFPYQIRFDGQQVENLRLSGETLAKIFTDQITNWDDPAITQDNNGVALPSLPITPVVQAEGSGATQQLSAYFAKEYPQIWQSFAGSSSATEYWPRQGDQVAENGSNQAMNYVASSQANGSISYVEYSFALSVNYPVAKILNSNGYYTLPTAYNVAVALEAAQINTDPNPADCASLGFNTKPCYLLQNLNNVYTDSDPRTYPLSSYVYIIEPTGTNAQDSHLTSGKRQAIADFEYYSICQGQKEIMGIGYSPLPVNLVEAAFGQVQQLQAADPSVDLSNLNILSCDNPTFVQGQPNENYLAQIAPLPPACDHTGSGPCAAGVTPNGIGATPTTSGTYGGAAKATVVGSSGGGSSPTSGGTTVGGSGSAAPTAGGGTTTAGPGTSAGSAPASATVSATLSSATLPVLGIRWPKALVPVGILLLLFIVPVVLGVRRSRRRARAA